MPRIPFKLLIFLTMAGFFYLYGLPRKATLVSALLRDRRERSALDSAKLLVQERIRAEICRYEDLCDYQPGSWEDFAVENRDTRSIVHSFMADETRRKFLFRIRAGRVSEIIDLR